MRNAGHLDTLIFFVTSRCNSKCRSCFYWEELNQTNDLSFGEIEAVSGSMPHFRELWLSGGEPTLREELPEILSVFYRANGVRSVNYPANGIQPRRLIDVLERVIARCPELRINLNLALDGFEPTHDRIRGVPGNFRRAMDSLDALRNLRDRTPELRVHINSVICAENIDEMLLLGEHIRDRHDLDGHYFQVIRGEPMDPRLLKVHEDSVAQLYEQLKPIYRHYASKVGKRKRSFRSRL